MKEFGLGEYRTRSGNRAVLNELKLTATHPLRGRVFNKYGDQVTQQLKWRRDGTMHQIGGLESPHDLIGAWEASPAIGGLDEH